jgi:hypothetical protein
LAVNTDELLGPEVLVDDLLQIDGVGDTGYASLDIAQVAFLDDLRRVGPDAFAEFFQGIGDLEVGPLEIGFLAAFDEADGGFRGLDFHTFGKHKIADDDGGHVRLL